MNFPNYDCDYEKQKHVHELTGSTATIIECRECHNHRFCTVSGEVRCFTPPITRR